MIFKKAGGKIFGVDLNKAERKALYQEVNRQVIEMANLFRMDNDASILWMLHVHFGFGPKRLKKAWELFYVETHKLRDHYLMSAEDGGWLCRQKLKEIGCDVEAWYQEEEGKGG